METIRTTCCIAGGGPAGMMLGMLLARAGIDVVVLEKHADFLRDFRGDTIHPSTLEVMHELGLLGELLRRRHQKVYRLNAQFGDETLTIADFSHMPVHCPCIVFMPQWDFLDFIASVGRRYAGFRLMMNAEVTDVIEENGAVVGVRVESGQGPIDIRAQLVVGADGRHSTVRDRAGLTVLNLGAPMDVLWFRLSKSPRDPTDSMGKFGDGHIFVMIDRGDYWQVGYVIPKGSADRVHAVGLEAFRAEVAASAPFAADRVNELADWDQIKLLTVGVDRLERWHRPGLLCIGDAAHTMSPVGGVGINLAIQDAVAASNILAEPLRAGSVTDGDLQRVQRRRMLPTRLTQRFQVIVQDRIITRVLGSRAKVQVPGLVRWMQRIPMLRRIPARMIGMGVRPEHVRTPAVAPVR
ncbi:MAG TPA: FAD-dependent oxidoreductase [Alphaproteobacteria bacterium]|nr:FAD-dependent oxidoreductase [Alphaproteobacteria bacterium]